MILIGKTLTLGELIQQIGNLIVEYERKQVIDNNDSSTQLLKPKEVTAMYPALTLYSINKAIKEERLPVIKIGNLNYFTKEDIEKFISSQTMKRGKVR